MASEAPLICKATLPQQPNSQVFHGNFRELILDGTVIYPSKSPFMILYEFNSPPYQALADWHSVQKTIYQVSESQGKHKIKSRSRHLYDFWDKLDNKRLNHHVIIEGQTSRKYASRKVDVSSTAGDWLSCVAEGYFKASTRRGEPLKTGEDEIVWKDGHNSIVAVETRTPRAQANEIQGLPSLELKTQLSERDLDLLVTCWAVRLWKEAGQGP